MMVTFDPRDKYQGQLSPRLTIKVLDPSCKHFYPCFRFQEYVSTAVEHCRRAEENRSTRIAEATSTLRNSYMIVR